MSLYAQTLYNAFMSWIVDPEALALLIVIMVITLMWFNRFSASAGITITALLLMGILTYLFNSRIILIGYALLVLIAGILFIVVLFSYLGRGK